jgi:hypothetical protein
MSVIFQTLKKMRSGPRQRQEAARPSTGRRNRRSLPGLLLSPPILVMALLLIGLGGYLTVFGFNRFKEMFAGSQIPMPAGVSAQAAENPSDPAKGSAAAIQAEAVMSVAAPPEIQETDGGLPKPASPSLPARPPEGPAEPFTASYLPPQAGNEIALQPADPPNQQPNRLPEPVGNGPGRQAQAPRLTQDADAAFQTDRQVPAAAYLSPATLSKTQDRPEHMSPIRFARQIPAQLPASAPLVESASVSGRPTVLQPPAENIDSELSPDRIRHRAAVEKSSHISGLIEAAQAAIGRMDADATRRLLDQLGRLKGPGSPYVLNLTAYWCLKRKDYAAAGKLLQQVLDLRHNDLEAGYNMALVEIHTRRPQDAYRRLASLREIYPDNLAVADLMVKLK